MDWVGKKNYKPVVMTGGGKCFGLVGLFPSPLWGEDAVVLEHSESYECG